MIKLTSTIVSIATFFAWFRFKVWPWLKDMGKVLEPIIKEVEQAAQDGTITKDERKKIATDWLNSYLIQKNIKLNFVQRFIASKIIDKIASALPDFNVDQNAKAMVAQAIEKFKTENK